MARSFDEIVRDATNLDELEQQREARTSPPERTLGEGTPIGETLGPVLQLERGDAIFWLTVAEVVLLFLIWRKL